MVPRESIRPRIEQKGYEYDFRTAGSVWADDCVGAILDRLDQLDLADNTAVVFTTDHNARGSKGSCYQQGTRIPFAMRLKDRIAAGSTCDQMIQMIDIFPTFMEMCDIKLPSNARLDGISAYKALARKSRGKLQDELYYEFGYTRAIRHKNWTYIAFRLPDELLAKMKNRQVRRAYNYQGLLGNERPVLKHYNYFEPDQLYNLHSDPDELINLARKPEYADKLKEMKRRLKKVLSTFDHPFDVDSVDPFYHSERYHQLKERARADVSFEGQYWWENECVW
jgi:arylsulfatase A-like enzyme